MTERLAKKSLGKTFLKSGVLIGALLLFFMGSSIVEVNDRTNYQVVQYPNGTIRVVTQPGPYLQLFGSVRTYKKSGEYNFSKHKEDGGAGFDSDPIPVTFSGRSSAGITGFLKYRLPANPKLIKELDAIYGSDEAIRDQIVRNSTIEAVSQTSPLFIAEEADAPKRDQFRQYALGQLKNGIYKKRTRTVTIVKDKKKISTSVVQLVRDEKTGMPIVVEISAVNKYQITIDSFNIKEIDWDPITDKLLAKKKEIDMKRTLSTAASVTAQQKAIQEEAEGKARVAKAEADALVLKKTAVIQEQRKKEVAVLQANKKYEIAKLAAKEAIEGAKKVRAEGMAKAYANQALVKAGLTPLQAANIRKETLIGMMNAWAKRPVPANIISTGGGRGGSSTVMDIMGVEAARKLIKNMDQTAKKQ